MIHAVRFNTAFVFEDLDAMFNVAGQAIEKPVEGVDFLVEGSSFFDVRKLHSNPEFKKMHRERCKEVWNDAWTRLRHSTSMRNARGTAKARAENSARWKTIHADPAYKEKHRQALLVRASCCNCRFESSINGLARHNCKPGVKRRRRRKRQ